ncbi:methyltransferase, FxLD system [Streptomyces sp. NPDC002643]
MTATDDSTVRHTDALRAAMVRALRDQDAITSESVAAAFGAVPRHMFAPEAPSDLAYDLHGIVPVKKDEHGLNLSVMSAAHLQAVMLEQAGIQPGMKVLEIGSGGYNAALIQELVGHDGVVTTVDIDGDIVDRARQCLDDAGYGQVKTVLADGETGVPDGAPYDRIIVTASAWDIPSSWISGLSGNGRLVVPLTIHGTTRSIAFDRDGEGLLSHSYRLAHFVPMRGEGAATEERKVLLRDGVAVKTDEEQVRFVPEALNEALDTPRLTRWSGAAYDLPDELDLYLTLRLPSVARLHASKEVVESGLLEPSARLGVAALVGKDSIAYRTRRVNEDTDGFESGVVAHGPQAEALADQYADLLRRWAHNHRRRGAASITYVPGPAPSPLPQDAVRKRHGIVTATWH